MATLPAEAVTRADEQERDAPAQLTLLSRVGAILGSGLPRQETLDRVAELLVPGLAAWCAIDLADEDGAPGAARALPKAFPLAAGRAARPGDRHAHGRARARARDHRGRAVRASRQLAHASMRELRRRCACR